MGKRLGGGKVFKFAVLMIITNDSEIEIAQVECKYLGHTMQDTKRAVKIIIIIVKHISI